MFSFFKRKKPSPAETDQQDSVAPDENAVSDEREPEPYSAPQSPLEPSSPASEPVTDTMNADQASDALEPEPTVELELPIAKFESPASASASVPAAAPTPAPAVAPVPDLPSPVSDLPLPALDLPSPAPELSSPASELQHDTPIPALAGTEKSSWLSRLKKGLSRTGQNIGGLFVGVKVDESLFEDLETALIMADAGVEATEQLLTALRARVRKERLSEVGQVKAALRDILADHLAPLEKAFPLNRASPLVIMIAGVNGAGKTTSIGKLAYAFQAQGAKVLLAAGDTFRAAAREQLMEWGARNNVTVIAQDGGDPAAVAFDAVNAGRARQANVVMVDTAGRLPTQLHLMEELKKIKRVIGKADGAAPHEVLLVIDGNTGQNAIAQIRAFDAAITLTGLVVTKLDGTAKGGTLAAVAAGSQGVRPVPVYWIGVGESLNDLQPFVAREFAAALIGD